MSNPEHGPDPINIIVWEDTWSVPLSRRPRMTPKEDTMTDPLADAMAPVVHVYPHRDGNGQTSILEAANVADVAAALARSGYALISTEELAALRAALEDANSIVSMTRQHLEKDHPDCPFTALGVMNDASRAALEAKGTRP